MNTHDIELPPEFQSGNSVPVSQATIKRERMEEILRSAIEADRKRRVHPSHTHCDNCGCTWLDDGLNPVGCPYCQRGEPDVAELVEALTELCDEIDKHHIHTAISETSISWFKRKARNVLAAAMEQQT